MVDKLIKKGMVNKKMVSDTENEVSLELTEKGILVYNGHEEYHKELYEEISQRLDYLSDNNIETIFRYFKCIRKIFRSKNNYFLFMVFSN